MNEDKRCPTNLARAAFEEMQARLPGGAGPELAALIASWDHPGPETDDYAVVSAGQLATLGALFYGRLDEIRLQWAPGWESIARPAQDMQSAATADQIVNTGQAKHLFAGLEGERHLHPADLQNASVNPSDFAFGLAWLQDGDGDGTPDFQQVAFYQGHTPWLVIVSGAGQAVAHGEVSAAPVVIRAAQGYASPLASRTYLLMRRSSGNVLDYANYELLEWLATTTTYTRAGPAFPSVQIGGVFDFDYAYYLGDDENGNPIHDSELHQLPLDGEPFMRKVTLTIPAGGVQSQTFMVDAAHLAIFNPLSDGPAKETLLVPETAPNSCYLADCFLLPIEIMQHPVTATSGAGDPPTTSSPIRFCRWLDAYPNGQRDNQFADKDRDRFQIRIPLVIPNLTKMRIKATDLHGAVINGAFQNKTTDGNYEVDMKQENGGMVSEPILLVSDGDDDVTFNGMGTDNGKNDQTLLADFGSKIVVTFPELGNGETTFQVQQPIGTITLDMVYCHPGAPPVDMPGDMIPLMERQAQKMREIYRQIGIKVDGFNITLLTFPEAWVQDNGPTDPEYNLNGTETDALMSLVESNSSASNRIRVGFVNAALTNSLNGNSIGGIAKGIGLDPCLVAIDDAGRRDLNVLAHEAGHASTFRHNYLYDPNIDHWLMREAAGSYWLNNSNAAKRFRQDDADYIKANSSYYVPAQ